MRHAAAAHPRDLPSLSSDHNQPQPDRNFRRHVSLITAAARSRTHGANGHPHTSAAQPRRLPRPINLAPPPSPPGRDHHNARRQSTRAGPPITTAAPPPPHSTITLSRNHPSRLQRPLPAGATTCHENPTHQRRPQTLAAQLRTSRLQRHPASAPGRAYRPMKSSRHGRGSRPAAQAIILGRSQTAHFGSLFAHRGRGALHPTRRQRAHRCGSVGPAPQSAPASLPPLSGGRPTRSSGTSSGNRQCDCPRRVHLRREQQHQQPRRQLHPAVQGAAGRPAGAGARRADRKPRPGDRRRDHPGPADLAGRRDLRPAAPSGEPRPPAPAHRGPRHLADRPLGPPADHRAPCFGENALRDHPEDLATRETRSIGGPDGTANAACPESR
ncbi:UNVERIFIED_ORG: hypothetical protein CLV66_105118 [Actinomadura viridilutea]